MDGGARWAAVQGVMKSRTQLSDFTFTSHFDTLEKEMAPHSSVLAWRIPGTGEPGGLPSMGSHRVGHDWSDLAAAVVQKVKNLPAIQETQVQSRRPRCNPGDPGSIPWSGRSPEEGNGNPLQYSCLENSMDRGAWWATIHEVKESRTRLSDWSELNYFHWVDDAKDWGSINICRWNVEWKERDPNKTAHRYTSSWRIRQEDRDYSLERLLVKLPAAVVMKNLLMDGFLTQHCKSTILQCKIKN